MKKIILSLSTVCALSMYANAQISIMPEAGINLSNMSVKYDPGGTTTLTYGNKIGWKLGASFLLPINNSFFVQPGLFFTTKGMRDKGEQGFPGQVNSYKATLNASYLEMPLNIAYVSNMGNAGSLFFTAGPYMGFGLSGKARYREYVNGLLDPSASEDSNIFGEFGPMKRFDFGLNIGIGYKLPVNVFVRAQYEASLISIAKGSDVVMKNKSFSFSAGYIFTFKTSRKSDIRTGTDK